MNLSAWGILHLIYHAVTEKNVNMRLYIDNLFMHEMLKEPESGY